MSTDHERGALGERFHDLPTPAEQPELSWEQMAPQVLRTETAEPEPKVRPLVWWWFSGIALTLLMVGTVYSALSNHPSSEAIATATEQATDVFPLKQGSEVTVSEDIFVTKTTPSVPSLPNNSNFSPDASNSEIIASKATLSLTKSAPTRALPMQEALVVLTTSEAKSLADRLTTSTEIIRLPQRPVTNISVPTHKIAAILRKEETTVSQTPPSQSNGRALSLMAGPVAYDLGYDSPHQTETAQLSGQLRLGYEQSLSERWFVAMGLELRYYRFQSAFEDIDENARIYQPGTVDTIFRNLTTGVETVSTTDTVGGTRVRRFLNDNVLTTVGLPLLVGYQQAFGSHRFSIATGPRVDFLLSREGKAVVGNLEVIDFTEAPQYGQRLRWGGRLEAGYDWQPRGSWSVTLRVGAQASLSDWSTNNSRQRPTSFDGMLGLRYRW